MANILRESQVEKYIMSPPTGSMVIEITPQVAEFMLVNTNHKNRPLSLGTVSKYQAEMEKNNWSLTGDSIKFGTDGLLKDCLLYTSPSPRDRTRSRMPSSA